MISVKDALQHAPRCDSEALLAYVMRSTRAFLYTHSEQILSQEQWLEYTNLITQRQNGLPVAYLTGTREFWSLPLYVNNATLIPRPETELLVELVLQEDLPSNSTVLDLGTGSGAIALAIAKERPEWTIFACDISGAALGVAQRNADNLHLTNINFFCSDWFSALANIKFDAIVSNPPYLAENDPHLLQADLRFEPKSALVSGSDGLTAINHIIQLGKSYLKNSGWLFLEHGYTQKLAVLTALQSAGYKHINCWQDYSGHDRVSGGRSLC